jgi:hypothetical protein
LTLRPLYTSKGDTRATNAFTDYQFSGQLQAEFLQHLFQWATELRAGFGLEVSVRESGFAGDCKLCGCAGGLSESGGGDGLASADPCFDFAWDDSVLTGFVDDAQIAVSQNELHGSFFSTVEMNSREAG